MIKDNPIRIVAKSGLSIENPPRANDIIPKIISNTEAIFDISCDMGTLHKRFQYFRLCRINYL